MKVKISKNRIFVGYGTFVGKIGTLAWHEHKTLGWA